MFAFVLCFNFFFGQERGAVIDVVLLLKWFGHRHLNHARSRIVWGLDCGLPVGSNACNACVFIHW